MISEVITIQISRKYAQSAPHLDERGDPTGTQISDELLQSLAVERDDFHGDWNYRIKPRDRA